MEGSDKSRKDLEVEREQLINQLCAVNEQLVLSSLKIKEQAEQEVVEEHNRLLTVIAIMDDEVWFCDAEGEISMLNEAAARGLGLKSLPDIQKRPIREWLPRLDTRNLDGKPRSLQEAPLLRSLKGETLKNVGELARHLETGEIHFRTVNSAPVRNRQGVIIGAVAVARDLAIYKSLDEALRPRNKRTQLP